MKIETKMSNFKMEYFLYEKINFKKKENYHSTNYLKKKLFFNFICLNEINEEKESKEKLK